MLRIPAALLFAMQGLLVVACTPATSPPSLPGSPVPGTRQPAEACATLQVLLSEAPRQFTALRGEPRPEPEAQVWDSSLSFPGSQCAIYQWGEGRIDHLCQWPAVPEAQGRPQFQDQVGSVRSCLGNRWTLEVPALSVGDALVYRSPDSRAEVALRYAPESEANNALWTLLLIVGEPNPGR